MSKQEGYWRWLGRFLTNQPRFWKAVAVGASKWIRKPNAEVLGGIYGIGGGILGAISDATFPSSIRYLTNLQWGLIILVGFLLLTHGLYREDKEAEYKVLFPEVAEAGHYPEKSKEA